MPELYLGALSGTSMDAIDIGLFEFEPHFRFLGSHSISYPAHIQRELNTLIEKKFASFEQIGQLDVVVGECFAQGINQFLKKNPELKTQIAAVGLHGQNLFHSPQSTKPFTWQIGDPNTVAHQTGLTVVSDFRRMDVAAGGQGAPLAPLLHHYLFSEPEKNIAIVNIGGICNISLLPATQTQPIQGYDIGPGNTLIDLLAQHYFKTPYDHDGKYAASGKVNATLLDALYNDPYFKMPPPKSTGREYFNLNWLFQKQESALCTPHDLLATVTHLTCVSIHNACLNAAYPIDAVYICGGGAKNTHLMQTLSTLFHPIPVADTQQKGLPAHFVETAIFAYLAKMRLKNEPLDLTQITGSSKKIILGSIHQG